MKGNRKAYEPMAAEREINEVKDVFRADNTSTVVEDPFVLTSIRLHSSVKNATKMYAAERGMKMQEVIETALKEYLNK